MFGNFLSVFPEKKYTVSLDKLEQTLTEMDLLRKYTSIIELDTYLFGIIYHVIFNKKMINTSEKEHIFQNLEDKIVEYKSDTSHLKSPNNLGHLRRRISDSIAIYGEYTINES